ncbi:ABC transporter permease subunit [Cohnella sp. CFH 77786]|uniref:carbohydrate ABC transporter permease n=1 Tax=Cohnella sp. CFH 77786 TaxID=2662265 RepID=UPI001C60B933|nr:sugar ABC transporter permease [Cohnella sp. CFH 77786]MBW5445251.1 ABC transporter permease subunit [Cohnella sp. CFH 77786]
MKSHLQFGLRPRTYAEKKALWGFVCVLPWLLGFLFFFFVPLLTSLRYSFSSVDASAQGVTVRFVGWSHYAEALTINTSFNRTLFESIANMVVNVPLIVIFSLFLAVLLNQKFIGRTAARAIFFLPVILASGIIMRLDSTSLVQAINEANAGANIMNTFTSYELAGMMMEAGVSETVVDYLTGAVDRIYQIVSQSGVQILIFLAGIQTISPQLYEASKMEGATGYEAFWKITFPMVSPLILVNVVYSIIDAFSTNAMTELIRDTGFKSFNFGLSSAMAWIYFLAVSVILLISTFVISRKVFYHD